VFSYRILATLRERLGTAFPHVAYERGRRFPAGGLVTFSRLPLAQVSYRSYAGVLARRGGLMFQAAQALFSTLHGVLTVRLEELPVTIVNTHLSANHDGDWSTGNRHYRLQRGQLLRLNQVLRRDRDERLRIITGDFNVASDSVHYPLIVDDGARRDPFAATDPTTFHAAFLPPGAPPHRIDFVLVEGDEQAYPVLRADTHFTRPELIDGNSTYLSDHIGLSVAVGLAPVTAGGAAPATSP
jgi:hypothetical protein